MAGNRQHPALHQACTNMALIFTLQSCDHLHAGPSGSSVRDISFVTGAEIKSWTEPGSPNSPSRSARTFNIEVGVLPSFADDPIDTALLPAQVEDIRRI